MTKDYYNILNITEFSTTDEIKNAYRHLARQWHPDVAGNTPDILAKFKDINEAYEILSDKIKKADYDAARRFYNYAQNGSVSQKNTSSSKETFHTKKESNSNNKKGFSFNWEEFIARKQREFQYGKEEENAPKRGEDIYSDIEISIFEAINGTTKIINMLQTSVCPKCGGRKFVNGGKCEYCKGKGDISSYKRFNVKIPAGIKNNSKIRLAAEGGKGIRGGKNGDLYLTVHICEPKNYKTDGLNIIKSLEISPADAVLGAEKEIMTFKGNVKLKIAPNTKNGQKIRLAECGLEQGGKTGDMIVTIEIQIPQNLTSEEIALYKKLQKIAFNKLI